MWYSLIIRISNRVDKCHHTEQLSFYLPYGPLSSKLRHLSLTTRTKWLLDLFVDGINSFCFDEFHLAALTLSVETIENRSCCFTFIPTAKKDDVFDCCIVCYYYIGWPVNSGRFILAGRHRYLLFKKNRQFREIKRFNMGIHKKTSCS